MSSTIRTDDDVMTRHPVATAAIGPDGRILAWNRASEQLLGYSTDEILGQDYEMLLIPADHRERNRDATLDASEAGAACFTSARLHKDGSIVPVKVVVDVAPEDGVIFVDVRDERRVRCRCGASEDPAARRPARALTTRQRQVLRLMAEGRSTRDIANRLSLSVKTVETHRGHLMQRLKLKSVAGLVRYAVSLGLVPSSPWANAK